MWRKIQTAALLRSHLKTVHENIKDNMTSKCEICGYEHKKEFGLKMHKLIEHNEEIFLG